MSIKGRGKRGVANVKEKEAQKYEEKCQEKGKNWAKINWECDYIHKRKGRGKRL
jgi:hypothetical protein